MATTGIVKGRLLGVYVSEDSGATYDLVAHARNATLSLNSDEIDITTKDSSAWKEILDGQKSWSVSVDGLITYDTESDKDQADDLAALLIAGTQITLKFSTDVTGDTKYTGNAFVQSIELNAADNDASSYSATFGGNGALTAGTET